MEELTIVVVALAFSFDFVNGFHDAANAIATIVATKVLTPIQAVTMSAIGNFTGMMFGTVIGVLIAKTIGTGIIDTHLINGWTGVWLILAVLVGAIGWDLITWWLGLPTSSSHALVGGLVGAGLALSGHTSRISCSSRPSAASRVRSSGASSRSGPAKAGSRAGWPSASPAGW
jgi:PiT family inorganic phosphate transporter